jgi:thiol-disulfide isomerase/thioredoxin
MCFAASLLLLSCFAGRVEAVAVPNRVDPLEDLTALVSGERDRSRVVNFWASWCGPCREELPMLEGLARAHPEVEVVLVSVDDAGDRNAVERALAPIALRSFQLGPDPAAQLAVSVKDWPGVIPLTLVLDRSGVEVGRVVGSADREQLEAILRGMTPSGG